MSAAADWTESPLERAENAVESVRRAVVDRYGPDRNHHFAEASLTSIVSRHPEALAELERFAETLDHVEAVVS